MRSMNLIVDEKCIALGLRAEAILFRDLTIGPAPPELRAEICREAELIRTRFASPAAIRSLPQVLAFQELLRKVGVSTKKFQPSVERLLTYALKRGDLPAINSFVD